MRIDALDALRGFAILGILVMNVAFHNNMLGGYAHFDQRLLSDEIIIFLQSIFADGRFRTLFCILFGAGMAVQYASCERKGINHKAFFKSRLNWLLLFGFLHALFVFGGDILMLYSISAMLLISRLSLNQDELLSKGKRFFIIGTVVAVAIGMLMFIYSDPETVATRTSEEYLEQLAIWQGGYLHQAIAGFVFALILLVVSPLFILWQVLGLMMIGAYLYRSGFFESGFSSSQFRTVLLAAVLTTALTSAPQLFDRNIDIMVIPFLSSFSAVFVALIYAHIIIKLCNPDSWLWKTLINCGKMAFSLYILQSICMALLFRLFMPMINPDFHATSTMLDFVLIFIVFTVVQMVVASVIISNYSKGPLETLWRKAYLRSFKRKKDAFWVKDSEEVVSNSSSASE